MEWLKNQWEIMGQEVGFSWRWTIVGFLVCMAVYYGLNWLLS